MRRIESPDGEKAGLAAAYGTERESEQGLAESSRLLQIFRKRGGPLPLHAGQGQSQHSGVPFLSHFTFVEALR